MSTIKVRRGTKSALDGITLAQGEVGYTTDSKELYIGDGTGNHLVGGLSAQEVSASSTASTTSSSYVTIATMEITPAAGTYIVTYSASGHSTQVNQDSMYALHKEGTIIAHTEREFGFQTASQNRDQRNTLHTQAIVSVNGSEEITLKAKTNTGTFYHHERSLILLKVGN